MRTKAMPTPHIQWPDKNISHGTSLASSPSWIRIGLIPEAATTPHRVRRDSESVDLVAEQNKIRDSAGARVERLNPMEE